MDPSMNGTASYSIVTDLTIRTSFDTDPNAIQALQTGRWRRFERDLLLDSAADQAWLYIQDSPWAELASSDLVVRDVKISTERPVGDVNGQWERRPGNIWLQRTQYSGPLDAISGIDVLFGTDAVDPRPGWTVLEAALSIGSHEHIPSARLTLRHGEPQPRPAAPPLKVADDGTFKILQVSDFHMVTGVGTCNDAIDAHGQALPASEADPLTVKFFGVILDAEKPDIVLLTGDQLHHDHLDSRSAIYKFVAPVIDRSIPYAAVFGNHDDEGKHALSRSMQMSILQDLPYSLCQPGPQDVDGIGNYDIQILDHETAEDSLISLFLFDSHGQIASKIRNADYEPIKQNQINWFTKRSQTLRRHREQRNARTPHLSLAFLHIPFPEYADIDTVGYVTGGQRREPTEGPSVNSHLYNAFVDEGILAVGCGHDHVNDFCGLRSHAAKSELQGPWLCYGGGTGFGGYCSYDGKRYYRSARVWCVETKTGTIRTWKRREYDIDRVDEVHLVKGGKVVLPSGGTHNSYRVRQNQAAL